MAKENLEKSLQILLQTSFGERKEKAKATLSCLESDSKLVLW
jgi:hypothetical protein